MEVIGRVESGTETESNAGRLYGYRRLKMSGTNFPAVAEDVRSEKAPRQLLLRCSNKLHPCSDAIPTFPPSVAVGRYGLLSSHDTSAIRGGRMSWMHVSETRDAYTGSITDINLRAIFGS